jgi:integrase
VAKVAVTLAHFFDVYYLPDAQIRKKFSKQDTYSFDKHMRAQLGNRLLTDLDPLSLDIWVRNQLEQGYAPLTINKHIFLMNRLLNMARHWGFIQHNTFENRMVRKIPIGTFRQAFLTDDQINRLLVACKQDSNMHIYYAVKVLLLTGARGGELRNAMWKHIDWKAFVWDVPIAKGGRPRRIYLGDNALQAFQDIRVANDEKMLPTRPDDPIFMNPWRKKPYNHLQSAWVRCRERADLPGVRMHDLRHTYASILINKGVSLYEVQRLLGHHNISMTERYAHLLPNTLKNKVDMVGSFMA